MKLALLFALSLLSLSCTTPTDNPPAPADVLLPLKVGNRWIMQLTYSDTTQPGFDTMRVSRDTLIQNERWFYLSDAFFGPDHALLTNRSTGVWGWHNDSSRFLWKYPALPGETYLSGSDTTRVVSITAGVDVPAGHLLCYQYRSRDDWFLAPNLGFVKFPEFFVTDSTPEPLRSVRLELLRAILIR